MTGERARFLISLLLKIGPLNINNNIFMFIKDIIHYSQLLQKKVPLQKLIL